MEASSMQRRLLNSTHYLITAHQTQHLGLKYWKKKPQKQASHSYDTRKMCAEKNEWSSTQGTDSALHLIITAEEKAAKLNKGLCVCACAHM